METTKEKTRKSVRNLKAKYQLLCKVVNAIPSGCRFWYFPFSKTKKETSTFNVNFYSLNWQRRQEYYLILIMFILGISFGTISKD